ncbi:hypothetical protein Pmani_019929 [Petrolisthes manimaculis]|uniref:Uncharacterized protein n=1 Tax=Petrolisthes manimaculis TaxID=1843537 RepID=A0AAE1PJP8_9EUCA|nr:hypothetical protein Pmani_019929 [Petrolisthes manimaculis]
MRLLETLATHCPSLLWPSCWPSPSPDNLLLPIPFIPHTLPPSSHTLTPSPDLTYPQLQVATTTTTTTAIAAANVTLTTNFVTGSNNYLQHIKAVSIRHEARHW